MCSLLIADVNAKASYNSPLKCLTVVLVTLQFTAQIAEQSTMWGARYSLHVTSDAMVFSSMYPSYDLWRSDNHNPSKPRFSRLNDDASHAP